jgi:RNA polymerase sigma-54 factor
MDLGIQLNIGARLEQKLSPQMIQSLKLLQVNSLELELMIKQEIEMNPLLEMEEDIVDVEPTEKTDESKEKEEVVDSQEDIDWDEYLNDFDSGYKAADTFEQAEESYERSPTYGITLEEVLLNQVHDLTMKAEILNLVEYIIYSINDDGLLLPGEEEFETKDSELLEIENLIKEKSDIFQATRNVREAFFIVWKLKPLGVGARSLKECLLLQARKKTFSTPLCMQILEKGFGMFRKMQISGMARKFDATSEEVHHAIRELAVLDPRPGRQINQDASPVITPDLVVEDVNGSFVVSLNDKSMPKLSVSQAYASVIKKGSKSSKDEKKFVRDKLATANWLVKSIDQRKSTMTKVMTAIVEAQHDFFAKGPAYLKPLILQDIADKIGMHISTVNRVTNGKYVQIDTGVYELKHFFSASVKQEDGTDVSAMQAKEAIKTLVEDEDSKKPLSDQKIADTLKSKGLKVARRTVAKYREQLEILPARMRKRV